MVKHHAIRATGDEVQIVEKEYYYGSCPHCYTAGPIGKVCQNPRCVQSFRFISIYAREQDNPGSAIHRCLIAGAPVMIMYDDGDHPECSGLVPDDLCHRT